MRTSIGKSTLIITASKLASLLMNMLCVMVLARIRTLEEYGTYSQLLMSISIVSTVFMMGLPNSVNYFLGIADSQETRQTFLGNYYTLNMILSVLVGICLCASIPLLEKYWNNELIGSYAFFLLLYPFASLTMPSIESVLVVYDRSDILLYYRFLNSLSLLLIVLLADRIGMSFRQYMICFLSTELCFALAVYVLVTHIAGKLRFSFSLSRIREIAVFCIPLGLATSIGTLSAELDKLVISFLYSTEEYAIYSNAAKELPLTALAAATTMVIMPKIVALLHQGKSEQAVSLWKDSFVANFTIMAVLVTGIIVYAPEAITLLYSEKYLPGVSVFRIYTLFLLMRCTYFAMILNALGYSKYIFYNSILMLGLNVVFNILFYSLFGFIGPALATVVETLVSASILYWETAKKLHVSVRVLIPYRELLFVTLVNIVFGAIFGRIKALLPLEHLVGNIAEAVLLGVVWVLLYGVLMLRFLRQKWAKINQHGG